VAPTFSALAQQLVAAGRDFYARGWVLGTSGNFSAVVERQPLRLAITSSGVDKGQLTPAHIVEIGADARVLQGTGQPSAESLIHVAIVNARGAEAGSVLHTHSIWSTILSEAASDGGLAIAGYEMLKGLREVRTHEHREWLPIVENTQDWAAAMPRITALLREHPAAHGFLIRGHGLYTWGADVAEARRHVEILEFLLEVLGRKGGNTAWPS
jgi:methylthioribulose-1-phosphate dehydratase